MYIAHGPISYLANEAIQNKKIRQLKMSEQILVALLSLFFGILPDFDILVLSMLNVPRFIHHDIITHTPIFYIVIWIFLKISISFTEKLFNRKTGEVLDKRLLNILANTFLISTLFHLIADFLVESIMLLYPISNVRIFLLRNILESNLFVGFLFTTALALEFLLVFIFLLAVYKKYFKRNRCVSILLKTLITLSVIYLPLSMYLSLNTYNSTRMYGSDGKVNYDIDYDGISDKLDMDIGNTGKSNIEKADHGNVLDATLNIVNSGKWTNNHSKDVFAKVKDFYGGFDSYRLIAQSYYDIHLPIDPVLRDYHNKKYGFKSYFYTDYDYPTLLFEYLQEEEQLIELNLDANVNLAPGKIFFVKEEKILNLGVTLEGNYLASVLDTDESISMHSYRYLREYYGNKTEKIYMQK